MGSGDFIERARKWYGGALHQSGLHGRGRPVRAVQQCRPPRRAPSNGPPPAFSHRLASPIPYDRAPHLDGEPCHMPVVAQSHNPIPVREQRAAMSEYIMIPRMPDAAATGLAGTWFHAAGFRPCRERRVLVGTGTANHCLTSTTVRIQHKRGRSAVVHIPEFDTPWGGPKRVAAAIVGKVDDTGRDIDDRRGEPITGQAIENK
jgi:hypothetical protein